MHYFTCYYNFRLKEYIHGLLLEEFDGISTNGIIEKIKIFHPQINLHLSGKTQKQSLMLIDKSMNKIAKYFDGPDKIVRFQRRIIHPIRYYYILGKLFFQTSIIEYKKLF